MDSENNGIKESNQEFFLTVEKNLFFGNQATSENKNLLTKYKINHILLVGNEFEAKFKEVNFS